MAKQSLPSFTNPFQNCQIPGCERTGKIVRGRCGLHYQRFRSSTAFTLAAKPDAERFWSRVRRSSSTECWEWAGYRNAAGYGQCQFRGRLYLAHRVSWILSHNGDEPTGIVRHACDNPPCVNPAHLQDGSLRDNAQDAIRRGRQSRGAKHSSVPEATVREMFRLSTTMSQRKIARVLGVGRSTVWRIFNGKRWQDDLERVLNV